MTIYSQPPTTAIIIGAGFSGLTMACQLKRVFDLEDFYIYDRTEGMGGTWWNNTYPGCAVDIPAICYSLSFAPNPNFSKLFPSQPEILDYVNNVAAQYDVHYHFTGSTEWRGAQWRESTKSWTVTFEDLPTGKIFTQRCKILISGVGGLVNPNDFDVPGAQTFKGDIVHTARWNPNLDLTGKHVAVVGNGCSAAQLVPAIADQTKSVTQFMRTPHHIMPSQNYEISETWRIIFRYVPGLLFIVRLLMFLYMESGFFQFGKSKAESLSRKNSAQLSANHVRNTAPEKYWDLLTPKFEFGCKRRVFDHGYLASLNKDNIRLTDDRIASITENSVVTESGDEIYAHAIILATGFALTQWDVDIRGRKGISRKQHWEQYGSKAAFQSIAMSDFPNFFTLIGPNSGRAHTSTLLSIESYTNLILSVIEPVIRGSAHSVEVKASSERQFNRDVHSALEQTVQNTSCTIFHRQRQWEELVHLSMEFILFVVVYMV
ncbi:hypothetical protein N8T08_009762 [Aspergillus melleus]|uniref:Uncharacterized protein n=1 Tax=Aspergillus melleus TaxID=138277 RepID=A0ACC3AT09_9EURO|nr:hypothetical protein N8T08_009762 [Aspergillus melleus]